ncbi:MAG: glycosyltransferase family 9 protein [Spirochaetes bacterium]|nr:glycosyltransferase family 9 protein [Spirochaetota bacterium]
MSKIKIAIRIPNWIGDAVMSIPFVALARRLFENEEICLVMREKVRDVFINNKDHDKIIILNDKKIGIIRAGLSLRKYKFDIYFNLPESASSVLISYLSDAKVRIGYSKGIHKVLLNRRLQTPGTGGRSEHRSFTYCKLLGLFFDELDGFSLDHLQKEYQKQSQVDLFLTGAEIKKGREIIKKYKMKGKIIGLNPNSSAPSRRWLKDRFVSLADRLIKDQKATVVFFGSRDEKEAVSSITSLMKEKPIDLSGKISLREYMAVLKLIDLFITSDSGPMHLANSVGTDVIALEGPADIEETGMLNRKGKRVYIVKERFCLPCVKNICRYDIECMKEITVDDVIKQAKKVL